MYNGFPYVSLYKEDNMYELNLEYKIIGKINSTCYRNGYRKLILDWYSIVEDLGILVLVSVMM